MIHFKQRMQGQVLAQVSAGEVDWPALARCIGERKFECPGLFEIAPHEEIWSKLETSGTYLSGLGLCLR